jgi:hypothetical protein
MAKLNGSDMSKMRENLVTANCKHSATIDEHPKIIVESTKIASSTGGHTEVKPKTLKKPKLTFKELLAKYQREADAKCASQSKNFRQASSYSKQKVDGLNRQHENFHTSMPFQPGPAMHMPWECPSGMSYSYPSWSYYNTWMSYPPMHGDYFYPEWATPRRPTRETYSNNDCFNQTNQSGARGGKKTIIKQVYSVKKDGHKGASSDLISNDKKLIKVLETSAIKGKKEK